MVSYIRSDLDFILAQIKIAEDHALFERTGGAQGKPLFGPTGSIPTYNLSWGLRTVDGTYNNLLNPQLGAADNEFPEGLGTQFRTIMVDPDGPGPAPMVPVTYTPGVDNDGPGTAGPGDVFDPYVRTISNLIVDQTLGNPSAILTGLQRAGIVAPADQMTVTAQISAAYAPLADEFKAVSDAERADAEAQAALSASPGNQALIDAAAVTAANLLAAQTALDAVDDDLMAMLSTNGIELEGANVKITNTAPDEGLSAPFNSWFTLFGQFFDHGLDLVAKGGNGTVFIPLMPDDPLYVPGGTTNFMVLTRATLAGPGADGVMGTADDTDRPVNTTTSFVDQNQTYTSHPSHQVFLREYELNAAGEPVATGRLIEGVNGGMATWADLKAQARNILGIELVDAHVGNLPLLATDAYGNFIPDPVTGFPQVVMAGPPQFLASGTPGAPLSLVNFVADGPDADALPDLVHLAVRTGHAFLADIAHNAVPTGLQDGDITIGLGNPENGPAEDGSYDNELLDAHFVAGDGRANENIGLTAVHHVFHSEHNRLAEHTKAVVLADATAMLDGGASQAEAVAFLNEWLINDVAAVPASAAGLIWDGERLFQAAKFGTEMQYQHLVFEEFARKIQPNINVFLVPDGYDVTLDPSIVAEFAHVVYRFGHSMLTETIDRFDPNFNSDHIGLIEGFLNPLQFMNNGTTGTVNADIAAGAIIRGMTRQAGNQIDEFVTSALRNNLLGLPLDLATINLARGRDTGVPTLNEARRQFYEATNEDSLLKPYESWVDFAGHLKNEASIINFIASYGTHALITSQTTLEGKRDAALTIISGLSVGGLAVPADASDFLNGLGAYGAAGALGGLNNVDLWIGGLAEAIMPFGGMLGSTFNFVFEVQMENLQSGDRFYYLQRLDGLHLFGEMENNSFAAMIMRNTDATHLPSDVFSTPGLILEVNPTRQFNDLNGDGILESTDPVGGGILTPLVVRNDPTTPGTDTNYLRYTGGEHVVLGGTELADTLIAGIGDDTLFGDGGNDKLEGGFGNDIINGGDGDDIIKDSGGDDNIKAGAGNDVVHAGPGLDLVMGNDGQDFIFLGTDMGSEVFAGTGNDFIYGNKNAERILGNEGNDWIETGTFDGAPGDNFDEIFSHDTIDGHDVFLGDGGFDEFIGEGGDEIFVGSAGRGKMVGMSGFDWATYKDNPNFVNADLSIPIIFDEAPTLPQNAALDEYESVEGLSGTRFNDVLTGTNLLAADRLPTLQGGTEGYQGSALDAEGIALIAGLQAVLGAGVTEYSAGDIILGGDGSDRITGQEGDDIIDGDKWLDVQIGVFAPGDTEHAGIPIALHNSMTTLAASMFNGTINPGQLGIVRTIRNSTTQEANGETVDSNGVADVDTAVFSGARAEYDITFNPNGTITVAHTGGLATDGTDTLRNIEVLDFTDQDISLLAPTLDLNGDVITTTTTTVAQAYRDTFDTAAHNNSNGSVAWGGAPWVETNDTTTGNVVTGGQIQLDNGTNELRFTAGDGAQITRTVNLSGVTTATLSFDYDRNNGTSSIDAGESIVVQYSQSGSFAPGSFTVLTTINETSGGGDGADTFSVALNLIGAGPNSAIRFVSSAISAGEYVLINNFNIATTTTTTTTTPGTPGNNYVTNYVENGAAVAIAAGSRITDDGATMASARVILTNASAGDLLTVLGGLPGGITSAVDTSVAGQITLTLIGSTSLANYQTAIGQVRYSNNSENPTVGARTLQVTVNDGLLDSAVATTTVNVTATNDAPAANNDTVITNVAANTSFSILQAALLANDTDPEGSPITITAVGGATGLAAGPALGAGVITLSDDATAGGSFTYTSSDGTLTDPATVTINRVTTANITGTGANDIIVGNTAVNAITGGAGNDHINAGDGGDTVSGGTGNDTILAGTGNDTINWNANAAGDTDGFDMVNGEAGATDTFVVNGRDGTAETFIIYARAAALAAGVQVTGANSEIIITRTVAGTTTVIAELDNIEEISVNTLNTTINNGNNPTTPDGGTSNGDTIQVIGNFNAPFTSLNFSTITIDGNSGDDTVDISALTSAHRIVFRSNGGNDTIIGTLRPQDVIRLPEGAVPGDYEVTTDANGVTTMTSASQSISFTSPDGLPQFGDHDDDDDEDDDDTAGNDDSDDDCEDDDDTDAAGSGTGGVRAGTAQADVLVGTVQDDNIVAFDGDDVVMGHAGADAISAGAGADFVNGGDGRDVIFAGSGDDQVFGGGHADMIYGDAGADRILGEAGNDFINAGAGDDSVFGGAGNDLIVAEIGDGNDVYFGDDSDGGNGIDTLDMSAATVNVTVNLGSGPMSNGTASSSQTGNDTIWGIENVNTGSGSDTITASNVVNVMHGGAGGDTFRFTSASAAEGDTILGFEPGDRLDLTAIDASIGAAGDQSFTLVGGAAFTAAGQLAVTFETREDGEFTVVQGNIDGNTDADFKFEVAGHHNLTATNVGL
ncbi:peroxidase family protein [Tardiphaga sp. OK245]|uniref:peroxidase family protein n=1 Tax=Tardiphaga sp. OK245 TaxID=1855306 RepID=UPI0008A72FA7|nr:peroxidase family protein [Tardiphaga sp. OK245]SEI20752.1 Ca2+-binding protein, RTX toxin-related [Tardiphaga sp. OK245]